MQNPAHIGLSGYELPPEGPDFENEAKAMLQDSRQFESFAREELDFDTDYCNVLFDLQAMAAAGDMNTAISLLTVLRDRAIEVACNYCEQNTDHTERDLARAGV